jgi:glucokinase
MEKFYIGVDVGGTNTKAGLVIDGKLFCKVSRPTAPFSMERICDIIYKILEDPAAEGRELSGIGIGFAGLVEGKSGVVLSAANLGVRNLQIAEPLAKRYNVPVRIGNDVSMFALAESAHSKCDNLVYIAIGTGINTGVISGGRLLLGTKDISIEYGHTTLCTAHENRTCECGRKNCVECFVSCKAIIKDAKAANLEIGTPDEVFIMSDPRAKNIVGSFIENLVTLLLNVCNTYRPQKIVLGGGLAHRLQPHLRTLQKELKSQDFGYKNSPAIALEISDMATDGGIIGATILAQSN